MDNDTNLSNVADDDTKEGSTETGEQETFSVETAQLHVYTLLNLYHRIVDRMYDALFDPEGSDFPPNTYIFERPLAVMLDIYFMAKIMIDEFSSITGYEQNLTDENLRLFNELHQKFVDWKLPFHEIYEAKEISCSELITLCAKMSKCEFREKFKDFLINPVFSKYHRFCADNFKNWLRMIFARDSFVENKMELFNLCWKTYP